MKIYLLTEHPVGRKQLRMLTAVARYPQKNGKAGTPYSGKSWIQCRGKLGFVWDCYEQSSVLVFKGAPSSHANETYQSIAYIPLPEGLGVITIEAAEQGAFDVGSYDIGAARNDSISPNTPYAPNSVSEEVRSIISASVRDLLADAIREQRS